MAELKTCDTCGMDYDWQGVEVRNYHYCCEPCSRGEECTCPQHHHQQTTDQALPEAAANQLGVSKT